MQPAEASDSRKQYRSWGGSFSAVGNDGKTPADIWPEADYPVLICQKETASTGWVHWQFCFTSKKQLRFNDVKLAIMAAGFQLPIWLCAFSEAKDAPKANGKEGLAKYRNYCRKSKDPKGGTIDAASRIVRGLDQPGKDGVSRRGKRTDFTDFRAEAIKRKGMFDIADEELDEGTLGVLAKYPRFVGELQTRLLSGKEKSLKSMYCFWGPSQTGKSTRAYKLAYARFKREEVYTKSPGDIWWQGFSPLVHKCVVVDEFAKDGTNPSVHAMWLQIMDKNAPLYQVQNKGGSVFVDPVMIIFTSIVAPDSWIQTWNHEDSGYQYTRRFTQVFNCLKVYQREEDKRVAEEEEAAVQDILAEMPL